MDITRASICGGKLTAYSNLPGEKVFISRIYDGVKEIDSHLRFTNKVSEMEIDGVEIPPDLFAYNEMVKESLTSLTIKNTKIGDGAFDGCICLTDVILDNVKIRHLAFHNCPMLKAVDLYKVKSLRTDSFDFDSNFAVTWSTAGYRMYSGWVLGLSTSNCPSSMVIEDSSVSNIIGIAGGAFEDEDDIKSLIINTKSLCIGPRAFKNSGFESIEFLRPNTVRFIGHEAFSKSSLSEFDCDSHGVEVEESIFSSCKNLKKVIWPARIIPERTFIHSGLKDFDTAEGVSDIGKLAFAYCRNIDSLYFDDSVKTIGDYAFAEMGELNLKLPRNAVIGFRVLNNTQPYVTNISGNEMIGTWLYRSYFSIMSSMTSHRASAMLTDDVTGILPGAFSGVTLEELDLGKNCKTICPEALKGTDLKVLKNTMQLIAVPKNLFSECPNLADVDVYDDVVMIEGSPSRVPRSR